MKAIQNKREFVVFSLAAKDIWKNDKGSSSAWVKIKCRHSN